MTDQASMSKKKKRTNRTARIIVAVLAVLCVCGAAVLVYLAAGEMLERHTGESYYARLSAKPDEVHADDAQAVEERVEEQKNVIEIMMRQQWVRENFPETYEDEESAAPEDETAAASGGEAMPGEDAEPSGEVVAASSGGETVPGEDAEPSGEIATAVSGGETVPGDDAEVPGEVATAVSGGEAVAGEDAEVPGEIAAAVSGGETVPGEDAEPSGEVAAAVSGGETVPGDDAEASGEAVAAVSGGEAMPVEDEGAIAIPDMPEKLPEWARRKSDEGEDDLPVFDEEAYRLMLEELTIRPSSMDFAPIQQMCPDLVGWLRIDGTVIDYPIVKGPDDEYYLHHLADRKPNSNGAIMMEAENDPLWRDMITTLHGHHMRSGAMFGDLADYSKEGYYEEHPVAWVYTPLGDFQAQIFAACVVDPYQYGYPIYLPEEKFDALIDQFRKDTPFTAPVDVAYGDRLLVLSTCEYTFHNARYVVMAKLVPWPEEEAGEAGEAEQSGAEDQAP